MLKVLVVGQSPPPFGGQAIMIERFVKSDLAGVKLIHVRMGFSNHMNEVGRVTVSKIVHMFAVILRIVYHRFADDVHFLYFPPSGTDRVPMYRDIIILLATRWLFTKTLFHYHTGGICDQYEQLSGWRRWIYRRAYFGADMAIRLSELNPEDGKLLEAKRECIIPYGIDDPSPELRGAPAKPAANPNDPVRILFVGILRESKGVKVLIEACGKLAARGVPFSVELMGQWHCDDFARWAHRRIQELKIDKQLRFLGMLVGDEKFQAYKRADIFCFPSFFNCETFGVVLIEAMGCGLPTVTTRWRGIPSVVDDGRTGFIVEPNDSDAVADRLKTLIEDAALRERMGREGRLKFEREYTFPRFAERMRRVLLQTAGETSGEEATVPRKLAAAS